MNTRAKKMFGVALAVLLITAVQNITAHDLNPPPYRGDPLSIYAHWASDTGLPDEPDWNWVDDENPSTTLYPEMVPSFDIIGDPSGTGSLYQFIIPNIIDELPLKLARIQLTWVGTTTPPVGINAIGYDNNAAVQGIVTFASTPSVYTQPDGGYQYFDIEFRPNPDYEFINVYLPENAELVQVVFDSISTVPEPATLVLLGLGGLLVRRFGNKK